MSAELADLLELFDQPALIVRDGTVLRCNPAARSLTAEGTPLRDILKDSRELFELWDGTGTLSISLEFQNSARYDACARTCPEGPLFVINSPQEKASALDATLLISSAASLRRPLHSLLTSAGELFGQIDLDRFSDTASELNRSIYQLVRLSAQISEGVPLILGQKKARRVPVSGAAFFDSFADQVRPLIEASGRSFIYHSLREPLTIDLDTALVERALFNLVSNAITYSPRGSSISLALHVQEKQLLVSVSDRGEGVSPQVIATLFERYADRPIGDSRWGLGLGLPMVREISRLHGGTMILCTGEENRGTTAVFSLSLEPVPDLSLRSPLLNFDYCGGLNHALVELSDCLDKTSYHPGQV